MNCKYIVSNRMLFFYLYLCQLRFHYTPEEVVAFCKNCVLSDAEEPCNIPDEFFDAQLMP
jgi:hypothetical protein